jgi:hypothetical protein
MFVIPFNPDPSLEQTDCSAKGAHFSSVSWLPPGYLDFKLVLLAEFVSTTLGVGPLLTPESHRRE